MDWIEAAVEVMVGWTALALVLVACWSRFMTCLQAKEGIQRSLEVSSEPSIPAEKRAS